MKRCYYYYYFFCSAWSRAPGGRAATFASFSWLAFFVSVCLCCLFLIMLSTSSGLCIGWFVSGILMFDLRCCVGSKLLVSCACWVADDEDDDIVSDDEG